MLTAHVTRDEECGQIGRVYLGGYTSLLYASLLCYPVYTTLYTPPYTPGYTTVLHVTGPATLLTSVLTRRRGSGLKRGITHGWKALGSLFLSDVLRLVGDCAQSYSGSPVLKSIKIG